MTTGNNGGASGTPTSPIRSMMSLEPIITPTFTPQRTTTIAGEAPQQGGSTITTALMSEIWRLITNESTSSATVLTQNAPSQRQQLTTISSSTTPPTVDNASGMPTFSKAPPLNQMTREQMVAFQTPSFVRNIPFNTTIPRHSSFTSNHIFTPNPPLVATQPPIFPFQQQSFYGLTPRHLSA